MSAWARPIARGRRGLPRDSVAHMRRRIVIHPRHAALIACAMSLVALVHVEGWIWPLKAAAVMIPVSLIVG